MTRTRLLGAFVLLTALAASAPAGEGTPWLDTSQPIERDLAGGQRHTYQLPLKLGEYLYWTMSQKGVEALIGFYDPDGKALQDVVNPLGNKTLKSVRMVAEKAGTYQLEVRAEKPDAAPGRYTLRVVARRSATSDDRALVRALVLFGQAERLRAQDTASAAREAIAKYEEALPIFHAVGDRAAEGPVIYSVAKICASWGYMQKALGYYEQALSAVRQVGSHEGEASVLGEMGVAYSGIGEFQKALECYQAARQLHHENQKAGGETAALNNIGQLYYQLGDPTNALQIFEQALALTRSGKLAYAEANMLNSLGGLYREQGDYQKALAYHQQALTIHRAQGDHRGEAAAENLIGLCLSAMGQSAQAIHHYEQALAIHQSNGNRRGEARTLTHLGANYRVLGNPLKARGLFEQALSISSSVGDRSGDAAAQYAMAQLERDVGSLETARSHIEKAVAIFESLRAKVASDELRASYLASEHKQYALYIDILMDLHAAQPNQGHDRTALEVSERARARSFLEHLADGTVDIRAGVDPALLERERSLHQQLEAIAERHGQVITKPSSGGQAATLAAEMSALASELDRTEGEIRINSPRYASLMQPRPLTVREIQEQLLDDDTLLLEYALGETRSYLWMVTKHEVSSHLLSPASDLEALARRAYDALSRPEEARSRRASRGRSAAGVDAPAAAAALSQVVLGSVRSRLSHQRLLIVADGALQYVPFAVLPDPTSRGIAARPLVLDHEVIHLPSASVLAGLRRGPGGQTNPTKSVAAFADPVLDLADERVRVRRKTEPAKPSHSFVTGPDAGEPRPTIAAAPGSLTRDLERATVDTLGGLGRLSFSRQEADAIVALAGAQQSLRAVGFQASRANAVGDQLGNYRIVHFATHGLVDEQHPALSGIILSLFDENGEPQNGILRLHDIYNLKLAAELVVLSACRTALGKQIRGEGLVGLTQGFMYAGAPRVVASMWKVDDEATFELMKRFYHGLLREGLRPPAALRAAQIAMRNQKPWQAPYYWGAFVLQGEWQ